jgi:hypothetical protein
MHARLLVVKTNQSMPMLWVLPFPLQLVQQHCIKKQSIVYDPCLQGCSCMQCCCNPLYCAAVGAVIPPAGDVPVDQGR